MPRTRSPIRQAIPNGARNVFHIVRKARDTAAARRALILLRDVFASVAPDQRILNQAIDSDITDFEDAIQLYSAIHAGADYLLTRNVGDFPAGILPILAPDEFLALLDRAADDPTAHDQCS